eukprot:scaffold157_cov116-Cylindrotheca_fusiformis.AAC.4
MVGHSLILPIPFRRWAIGLPPAACSTVAIVDLPLILEFQRAGEPPKCWVLSKQTHGVIQVILQNLDSHCGDKRSTNRNRKRQKQCPCRTQVSILLNSTSCNTRDPLSRLLGPVFVASSHHV